MDYIRSASRFVGVRFCQRLRYWRIHSPAFGNRRRRIVDPVDSRAKVDLSRSRGVAFTSHATYVGSRAPVARRL